MSRTSQANPEAAPEELRSLLEEPAAVAIADLPPHFEALLVGGALRDRLLGRPTRDFDAVVARDGEEAAGRLAEHLGLRWFRLGGERFAAFRLEGEHYRVDLFDRTPMSLAEDLYRRDFTVNSMALDLGRWQLLDPSGGRRDLEQRRLRATTERSFEEDPLRVLRLVRFSVELEGFAADPGTLELARSAAPSLSGCASERIREELRTALARPTVALAMLRDLGVYPSLWSPGPIDQDPSVPLERLAKAAERLSRTGHTVDVALAAQAVLFSPLPEDRLEDFRARGLVSNREARNIARLLAWTDPVESDGERRWFLHSMGVLWPTAAAFFAAIADAGGRNLRPQELADLAESDEEAIFAPSPLLDGHEIAALLGLEPGPRLGEVVSDLRRAQIERRVRDRDAATDWLRRLAATSD